MYRTIELTKYSAQDILGNAEELNGCWIWRGSMYAKGYGKIGRRGIMAHRIAYEICKGDVPKDLCLDHLCKNRACINPDHLEIVTLVENVMRGESQHAVNARKTHCVNGHEFTPSNIYVHPHRKTRDCKICRNRRCRDYRMRLMAKKEG